MTIHESPVLEVRQLRVGFHRRRTPTFWALDDVSLSIAAGRTMGLVGESGSGKSTLARAILGLVPADGGSIELLGRDITHLKPAQRRQVGRDLQSVFQDPNSSLNPSFTVRRSLAEPLRAQGVTDRTRIQQRISEMLHEVGLDPAADRRFPRQFSGGQRQRICIARALMTSPQIVIADEAVSALDLSVQAQILNLLADLQQQHNVSYLFISHDMSVVRHACHDITVLYRGQVMEQGPTSLVTQQPAHPYTRTLLLAAPLADPLLQRARHHAPATTPGGSARRPSPAAAPTGAAGCPFADRCPFAIAACRQSRPEMRVLPDGRSVACHRYPEWQTEVPGLEALVEVPSAPPPTAH